MRIKKTPLHVSVLKEVPNPQLPDYQCFLEVRNGAKLFFDGKVRFGLVWFYGISTIIGYLMPAPLYIYVYKIKDLVLLVLWHINHYRLSKVKSSLFIYIKHMIWFGWVLWHNNHCRLFNVKFFIHIYQIHNIWFGWVLWHIKHCWLFNTQSSLYIYIKYIWFGWVGFYGISIIVGYLMPNLFYTYILNTYDLVWFCFMAYHLLQVI